MTKSANDQKCKSQKMEMIKSAIGMSLIGLY